MIHQYIYVRYRVITFVIAENVSKRLEHGMDLLVSKVDATILRHCVNRGVPECT